MTQESPAVHRSEVDGSTVTTGLIRAAGLRVTGPRVAVLQALIERPHVDADTVARAVRERLGSVSTQAVYDVLAALCRTGLVRRIEPAGSPGLFERETRNNHHHVVCRHCGTVGDIACAPDAAPCLLPDSSNGFVIDEAEVTFWGSCPSCQSEDLSRAGGP